MKKLLLSLIIITGSGLLHGMEVPSAVARNALPVFVKTSTDMMTDVTSEEVRTDKQQVDSTIDYSEFSLITLPQMYHQLSKNLLSEIAQTILSLQILLSLKSWAISKNPLEFQKLHKEFIKDKKEFICRFTCLAEKLSNPCGYDLALALCKQTLDHAKISICDVKAKGSWTVLHQACMYREPVVLKVLIEIAGDDIWTLLTTKSKEGLTPLHVAVAYKKLEKIKLILDAAGDKVQDLMNMRDKRGEIAFDFTNPEAQKIMLQYI